MPDRPIVDFVIVGAQKCATSSLFHILRYHPKLAASKRKETGFFLGEKFKRRRIKNLKEYESMFSKKDGQLAFEATPGYTTSPQLGVPEKIFKYNPHMKIIYVVRDPKERIVSAYRFGIKKGYIKERGINDFLKKKKHVVDCSKYYHQISPYLEKFGKGNVLIVFFEDFVRDPFKVVNRICDFLNIDRGSASLPYDTKSNTASGTQIPKKWDKKYIKYPLFVVKIISPRLYSYIVIDILQPKKLSKQELTINSQNLKHIASELLPDIDNLEQLTKRDLSSWKQNLHV